MDSTSFSLTLTSLMLFVMKARLSVFPVAHNKKAAASQVISVIVSTRYRGDMPMDT